MKLFASRGKQPAAAMKGVPARAAPAPVHHAVQRSHQATIRALLSNPRPQAALRLGAPGDVHEREADRIADAVVRSPATQRDAGVDRAAPMAVQRSCGCAACERDDLLQRRPNGHAPVASPVPAGPLAASIGRALRSPGQPLPLDTQAFMAERFGRSFEHVRMHTDAVAAASARALDAHAYTLGQHVVFDAGQYRPWSHAGRRLIAHELVHTVQQGATTAVATPASGHVQREVNPKRIAASADVLEKIRAIASRTGNASDPAAANLARLARLGIGFNPGASKEEKDNAFVYTCNCGWIDLGHFFISAAAAYAVGYQRKRIGVHVDGEAVTIESLMAAGMEHIAPALDVLLATVPGGQGQHAMADVRRLLASAEPRDIALALGYWMEFVQQVAKLVADPASALPAPMRAALAPWLARYQRELLGAAPEGLGVAIEGSARSAFTIEDLPSDCYGAALGQDVWQRTDGARNDPAPIHALMQAFFADCNAVFPAPGSPERKAILAETTPGARESEGEGDPLPAVLGEPARHGSTTARLLASAAPLCRTATVRPCRTSTGRAAMPVPAADLSVLTAIRRLDLQLDGVSLHASAGGDLTARGQLPNIQGLGRLTALAQYNLLSGRLHLQADGPVSLRADGVLKVDLERLFAGLAGPEVAQLKAYLQSPELAGLLQELITDPTRVELVQAIAAHLRAHFPNAAELVRTLVARLRSGEALALASTLSASGSVRIGGIPVTYFHASKAAGREPLLGFEGGLLASELAHGRVLVGAKGVLYGQDILQAQVFAGIDPFAKAFTAELSAKNRTLTGNDLSLRVRYQATFDGNQQFMLFVQARWASARRYRVARAAGVMSAGRGSARTPPQSPDHGRRHGTPHPAPSRCRSRNSRMRRSVGISVRTSSRSKCVRNSSMSG